MPPTSPGYVATGNINTSRFVKADTGDRSVVQCTANAFVVGISTEAGRYAPVPEVSTNYAAISGDNIHVYGDGEQCLLQILDTIANGGYIKSDANGYGVAADFTTTATQNCGAVALEAGESGQTIRVQVLREARMVGVGTPA